MRKLALLLLLFALPAQAQVTVVSGVAQPSTVPNGGTGANSLTAHGLVVGNGTGIVNVTGAGTAGDALVSGGAGADPAWRSPNYYNATPADPSMLVAPTTGLMAGLAGSFTTSAVTSGVVLITISGAARHTSTGFVTPTVQISYGTGTAPSNGAAKTGTQVGPAVNSGESTTVSGAQNVWKPFSITYIVTGLSASTTYWIDLCGTVNSGNLALTTIGISAYEF